MAVRGTGFVGKDCKEEERILRAIHLADLFSPLVELFLWARLRGNNAIGPIICHQQPVVFAHVLCVADPC